MDSLFEDLFFSDRMWNEIFLTNKYRHITKPKKNQSTAMYRLDENDDLLYEFVLPGYEKEEIELTHEESDDVGPIITVKAKNNERSSDVTYTVMSGYESKPESAKLKNGILTIKFKKKKTELIKNKIEIE